MAEQEEILAEETTETTEHKFGKRGMFGIIRAALILLLVVAVECALAIVFFPTAEETAAMAQKLVNSEEGLQLPDEQDSEQIVETEDTIEHPLGLFKVSIFQPLSGTTLRIDFDLYCTVLADDENEFLVRLEDHQRRLRDQIITILRGTEQNDLTDAGLGLIKRKVLETTNQTLGKAVVQEIIFSDFSHEEH